MAGPGRPGQRLVEYRPVLMDQSGSRWPLRWRGTSQQLEDGRSHVDQAARSVDHPCRPHTGAGGDERGPGLHDTQRPVLPEVAALVAPEVGSRVLHHQIGGGRVVEELGQVLEGMGIGIVVPGRMGSRPLLFEGAEAHRVLAGQRIPPGEGLRLKGPPLAPVPGGPVRPSTEAEVTVGRGNLVLVGRGGPGHHVHDRLQG